MRELLREPLLHFFLLAGALFLLDQAFSAGQKPRIVVDGQTAGYLILQREEREARVLSSEERAAVVDAWVEDEILYREAYRRGLDRGDSRMRQNLILKMRGLLTGEAEAPSEAELDAYFEANRKRFTRPEMWSLAQVRFAGSEPIPEGLLERLNGGPDSSGAGEGLAGRSREMPDMTAAYLEATFGPEAAREITAIRDRRWHGPIRAAQGVHFVRIIEHHPETEASYESVRRYLEGDWLMDRSRRLIRAEVERLRADYEIVIDGSGR